MNVSREEREKKRTCELAYVICDHQDLKFYPIAKTCCLSASKRYLWSLLSDCVSCSLSKLVHLEGDSLILLSLGRNSSSANDLFMLSIQFHIEELLRGFCWLLKESQKLRTKTPSYKES